MKKIVILFIAALTALIFSSCNKPLGENPSPPDEQSQNGENVGAAFSENANTKIYNDFAEQLPDFNFSNAVENYDESVSFKFTVKCSDAEFEDYVEALKSSGFVSGTEGAPVSGEGLYKATNSDRYMVEAVFINGELTVTVTRP